MSCKPELLLLGAMLITGACAYMPTSAPDTRPIEDLVAMRREAATYYQRGEFGKATLRYQELTARVPLESELWFYLGNSQARLGNKDEAVKAYREAVIRDPEYAKAWYNMGVLRLMEGTQILLDAEQYLSGNAELQAAVRKLGETVLDLIEEENDRLARSRPGAARESRIDPDEVEIIIMDRQTEEPASQQDSETDE